MPIMYEIESRIPESTYDETYSHLLEVKERSQGRLARIKDAFMAYTEIGRPLGLQEGMTLLDIGSGIGRPGHYLRHLGVETVNLDVNVAAHTGARDVWGYPQRGNFQLVGDGSLSIPLKSGSIDAISSQDFLEHIAPDRLADVLTEMGRVLKGDKMMHRVTVTEEPENLYNDETHQTFWSASEWKDWFEEQGWTTVAPTTRKTYAPHANPFGLTEYCHGYFLLERTPEN